MMTDSAAEHGCEKGGRSIGGRTKPQFSAAGN